MGVRRGEKLPFSPKISLAHKISKWADGDRATGSTSLVLQRSLRKEVMCLSGRKLFVFIVRFEKPVPPSRENLNVRRLEMKNEQHKTEGVHFSLLVRE